MWCYRIGWKTVETEYEPSNMLADTAVGSRYGFSFTNAGCAGTSPVACQGNKERHSSSPLENFKARRHGTVLTDGRSI